MLLVPTVTSHRPKAPFEWDPSVVRFTDPSLIRVMTDEHPIVLNCSFDSPSPYGMMGWMRCPAGGSGDACRYLWLTYDEGSSISSSTTYDDGHPASVTATTRRKGDSDIVLDMGLELRSSHENIGGHACVIAPMPSDDGPVESFVSYVSFVVIAEVSTEVIEDDGTVLRVHFSVDHDLVPNVVGATLLRIGAGPTVYFEGRLDKLKRTLIGHCTRLTQTIERDRTTFSLDANVTVGDIGFSFEIDDGHGGLIGRAGVRIRQRFIAGLTDVTIAIVTIVICLAAVSLSVPYAEYPFGLWCALCVGWITRTVADWYGYP